MRCSCNACARTIRTVLRQRDDARKRSFGIRRGKVGAHNRAGTCGLSMGNCEHVQIYIEDLGGRPITVPSRSYVRAHSAARTTWVRECVYGGWACARTMDTYVLYTEQLRIESGTVREKRGRRQDPVERGDAMRNESVSRDARQRDG